MKCNTLQTKIIFFLEGGLPQNEMEIIKGHLNECSTCAAFAREMERTLQILNYDKVKQVNPFFYTRVKARLENRATEKANGRWNQVLVRVLQPAFFSLLLLAGIYSGIKIAEPTKIKPGNTIYTANEMIPYLNEMETESIENFLME